MTAWNQTTLSGLCFYPYVISSVSTDFFIRYRINILLQYYVRVRVQDTRRESWGLPDYQGGRATAQLTLEEDFEG